MRGTCYSVALGAGLGTRQQLGSQKHVSKQSNEPQSRLFLEASST